MNNSAPGKDQAQRPRILLVEDEWLIAVDIEYTLEEAGYSVCGPARTVSLALDLIEAEPIDVALLDVNLGGENSYPVAAALRDRSKPFAFLSGHSNAHIDAEFRSEMLLSKPVERRQLLDQIARLLAGSNEGRAGG